MPNHTRFLLATNSFCLHFSLTSPHHGCFHRQILPNSDAPWCGGGGGRGWSSKPSGWGPGGRRGRAWGRPPAGSPLPLPLGGRAPLGPLDPRGPSPGGAGRGGAASPSSPPWPSAWACSDPARPPPDGDESPPPPGSQTAPARCGRQLRDQPRGC